MKPETKILQDKLSRMPLMPLNPRMRKARDKLTAKLHSTALNNGDIAEIDLNAGVF